MTTTTTPAQTNNLSIAPDLIAQTIAKLSAEQAEIVLWWYDLACQKRWNQTAMAQAIGVDSGTVGRVLRGTYPSMDAQAAEWRKARKNWLEGAGVAKNEFVATVVANRIFSALDKSRSLKICTLVWGKKGIGKTIALHNYCQQNRQTSIEVRCPASATFYQFLLTIARACNITSRGNVFEIRERIVEYFSTGNKLLVVDEIHQAFLTTRGDTCVRYIEFLREIHDRAGCGLVLVGTEVVEAAFMRGLHREALGQLLDRGPMSVKLPDRPSRRDLERILSHWGLDFPSDGSPEYANLNGILASSGLRKLCMHLRDGGAHAAKNNRTYAWSDFNEALEIIAKLNA